MKIYIIQGQHKCRRWISLDMYLQRHFYTSLEQSAEKTYGNDGKYGDESNIILKLIKIGIN